jgi:hypothetical protein
MMMQIRFELSESKELHGIHIGQNNRQKSVFFSEGNNSQLWQYGFPQMHK